ncbi:DL-endopeptidase inhibitor IseA family protein [Paenibacillus polymyxa]|uniref:DL-endopeptidase inhibitor IseA family protein n=1 Tax=Paenibacillus polymyxa TaxID=1406 RepID=UPI002AB5D157|nr:DL-endopeptidase inhibitor IseA family protein [Paenibacillus polymyxa]MDY7992839.1 DL-endopeptidase inhibitor IseA family protein [Paenibacillus polymyxa]MDY8119477.1 DL-endopeptidase inhibitor IseA family protein [Paenibacillus polymyxa]
MKINTKLSALCIAATLMSVAQAAAAAPVVTAPAEATQPNVASPSASAPAQVPAPAASASATTPAPAQAPSVPAASTPAAAAGSAKAATPAAPSAPVQRPSTPVAPSAPAQRPSTSVAPAAAPSVPSTVKPSKPQQPSTSAPAAAASSVKPTQLDKLNHESAVPLVLEAQSRYQYAINGGSPVGESFQLNGKSYRYLSEDIGTKTKLISYLTQAYTKQASEQFVGKFFVEVNGRLAQLNADGGNLLEFNRATAKMVTMTPVKRSYLLTVPYPAETKQANEKITVNFEKVGSYWKISSAPHVIF